MLKSFLKDSAVYGTATVLSRGIQVLLVPLYTRLLAPDDYGAIDLMMVAAAFVAPVLTLQVATGMGRCMADEPDPAVRTRLVSTAIGYTAAAAALLIGLAWAAPGFGARLVGVGPALFRVGALAIGSQMVFSCLIDVLRWELRPARYGAISVAFTLVSAGASVALVAWGGLGVAGVFWGQLIGYVLATALAAIAARDRLALRFDRRALRRMLAFSAPLVFSSLFFAIATLTDRIIINAVLGRAEVGVYGIGARVATTVALVITAFGSAVEPLILARHAEPDTPAHLARIMRVFLVVVVPVVLGLSLFADEILRLMVTPEYYPARDVIAALSVAAVLSGMTVFTPGLSIARHTRVIALVVIATSALNLALNVALIPLLGVPGAGLATLIGSAAVFAIGLATSQSRYPVPHSASRLGATGAVTAAAVAGGFAASRLDAVAAFAVKTGLWLAAAAAVAAVLLDRHDWRLIGDRLTGRHRSKAEPLAQSLLDPGRQDAAEPEPADPGEQR